MEISPSQILSKKAETETVLIWLSAIDFYNMLGPIVGVVPLQEVRSATHGIWPVLGT